MKLVREYINEKFKEDTDPIKDMGIGTVDLIRKWIKDFIKLRGLPDYVKESMFTINNDLTIDVDGDLDISYEQLDVLPNYIKFNHIKGKFSCCFQTFEPIIKNGPRKVDDDYEIFYRNIQAGIKNVVKKHCKVKGEIMITKII